MKFNFPEEKQTHASQIDFDVDTWMQVSAIAKARNLPVSRVVNVLLEPALGEYKQQYADGSVGEGTVTPDSQPTTVPAASDEMVQSATERKREYMREYMRKYMQRKREAQATPETEQRTEETKGVPAPSEWQQRRIEKHEQSEQEVDEAIKRSITTCASARCIKGGKFVLGAGYTSADGDYCSKTCADVDHTRLKDQTLAMDL